jgi:4-alpha-glucanotransferase
MDHDLELLAQSYGIATSYWDQSGKYHEVTAATVKAVLATLGADCDSASAVAESLQQRLLRDWRQMLPPVFVKRQSASNTIWAHVPDGQPVRLSLHLEDSETQQDLLQVDDWTPARDVDGILTGQASFEIPADLPLGWHTVKAQTLTATATCPLVVTPDRLPAVTRGWGLLVQLYSVRSKDSWGIGDLSDLTKLVRWSGQELDADFLLVNPLHAAEVRAPMEPSPYLPSTRRFANPINIHVEAIPEYRLLSTSRKADVQSMAAGCRDANVTSNLLERDRTWRAKERALESLYQLPAAGKRRRQFREYSAKEGLGLVEWATWCALSEEIGPRWQEWPADLQDPQSAAVARAQVRLADRIEFHTWLQWILDEQLQAVQVAANESGMGIGLMHDLAVGVHGDGADAWRLRNVLAADVSVGAPPDMYNQLGQNWAQPPWHPEELAAQAFVPYRDMLRSVLRHAGGIRVDHVLGLFRQWWIPAGNLAVDGTYVAMDHEALVGILALEAHRVGAVVVGEDLGTVEDWISESLNGRGILGTGVLWFKRSGQGDPQPPEDWREAELASVTVHDLPPSGAYIRGEHVLLRHELGLLDRSLADESEEHNRELSEWVRLLQERGFLAEGTLPVADSLLVSSDLPAGEQSDYWWPNEVCPKPDDRLDSAEIVHAMYRMLASSPARLVGVNLPDLVADRRAQNQPGTHREYPNWQIPLCNADGQAVLVEALAEVADQQILGPVRSAES